MALFGKLIIDSYPQQILSVKITTPRVFNTYVTDDKTFSEAPVLTICYSLEPVVLAVVQVRNTSSVESYDS